MDSYFKEKFEFWKNVYGFDMTPCVELAREKSTAKPEVFLYKTNKHE